MASGQRVLDVGAGVGDVAMLAARIVGPSGSVVAIERDGRTIDRARARAAGAGLHNVAFVEIDIDRYSMEASFDAVVGRYILQFLPDPVATLRSVAGHVRPGGIVAFQEGSWAPFLALIASAALVGGGFVNACVRSSRWSQFGDGSGFTSSLPRSRTASASHAHGNGTGLRSRLYALAFRCVAKHPFANSRSGTRLRRAWGSRHAPGPASRRGRFLQHRGPVDRARRGLDSQAGRRKPATPGPALT